MSFDPLKAMLEAGIPVDQVSDSQRSVLASLSQDETETLISVQKRVDAAGASDVEGHGLVTGIGIF